MIETLLNNASLLATIPDKFENTVNIKVTFVFEEYDFLGCYLKLMSEISLEESCVKFDFSLAHFVYPKSVCFVILFKNEVFLQLGSVRPIQLGPLRQFRQVELTYLA